MSSLSVLKRRLSLSFVLLLTLGLVWAVISGASFFGAQAAARSTSTPTAPGFSGDLVGDGPWVVRAYFDDPVLVARLAAVIEPWEVHYDKGYLLVQVDRNGYLWLLEAGFRVEIDETLTNQANFPRLALPDQTSGIPGYACYRTVEETYQSASQLASQYPQLASWIDIGDTWEKINPGGEPGYDLHVLRLTNNRTPGPKPKLFVMSSLHAREYTPAELNTRFAEYLLENYDRHPDVTWILDHHEIHLLLQANPDGRKKAESGLYWRKNTDNNFCSDTNYRGVDLNRNFEFLWGCCGGSSNSPCSEVYRGPSPVSEPETQAIQAYIRSIFPDQRADDLDIPAAPDSTGLFLDIHSTGRLVLWPWSFTSQIAPNGLALQTLGRKLAYFNNYTPQQAIELYPADGASDDFAYGDMGLAGYTIELGTRFFQDCTTFEDQIIPENLPALLYAAKVSRTPYQTPAGPDVVEIAVSPPGAMPGEPIRLTITVDDQRYNHSEGTEPSQPISAADFYLDIPPWGAGAQAQPLAPVDGTFNQPVETLTGSIDTSSLSPGRHLLFVRGQDAAGNWGAVSAKFVYVLDPDTAPQLEGYLREIDSQLPVMGAVQAGDFQAFSDPLSGYYHTFLISNTYDISAIVPGYVISTVSDIKAFDQTTTRLDFDLSPVCAAFADNVETGNLDWSVDPPWAISAEASHSPSHAWSDSPGDLYGNNQDIYLTSALLDLRGYSDVSLNFWHIYDMEPGLSERFDYGAVEYSIDEGSLWHEAAFFSGYDHNTWSQVNLPLPALDDQPTARLRFHFHSDQEIIADGWHIDDIQLLGNGAPCVSDYPPQSGFTIEYPATVGWPYQFTNTSSGSAPLTYNWVFGDGVGVSTLEDPMYTYNSTGVFSVTLTVSNTFGVDSMSQSLMVLPYVPLESIQLQLREDPPFLTGDLIDFQSHLSPMAASKPYTYTIDFGDSSSQVTAATRYDPLYLAHRYTISGTYTPTISAWNNGMPAPVSATLQLDVFQREGADLYLPIIYIQP